jgi:hypothetical protein
MVSAKVHRRILAFSTIVAEEWDRNADQFNDDYFKRLVARAILFRTTERIVSEQPWYQGGYRANVVTYAIAKLSQAIDEQCRQRILDLRQLWAQQSLPNVLQAVLTLITKAVFDVIVTPDSGLQNVTEWCKKEVCWNRAAKLEIDIDLPSKLRSLLIDKDEDRDLQKISTKKAAS